jgi:hypothetical protein
VIIVGREADAQGRPKPGASVMAALFGTYYVKPTFSAIRDAQDLFPKYRDYQEARRHALKLAFWPGFNGGGGVVQDLDWSWIDGMGEPRAAELRIHETIGGQDNLRIIFYVSKVILPKDPMPRIWTLSILQKKTKQFEHDDLKTFKGRLKILLKRYYQ